MSAYKVAKIAKPEVRDRVMGIVKYNILADTLCDFVATAVPTELIPEVRAFLADSTIAAVDPAPYYKQFAMMDREVFAAPRFALGLALVEPHPELRDARQREQGRLAHRRRHDLYL